MTAEGPRAVDHEETRLLPRGQRVAVLALGMVLIVHAVVVALYLAPPGPVRAAAGGNGLARYIDPYFQQGEDMMGLGSNRVDETLSLRARARPDGGGKIVVTDWVDVTAGETSRSRGSFAPSRTRQASRRLAANMNFAMFGLSRAQRSTVATITAEDEASAVRRELVPGGGEGTNAVDNFLVQDQMTSQYAALWLTARYPDLELVQVQYRVGRRDVPDDEGGKGAAVSTVPFDWFTVGWRPAFRGNPDARGAFDSYVKATGGIS